MASLLLYCIVLYLYGYYPCFIIYQEDFLSSCHSRNLLEFNHIFEVNFLNLTVF